MKQTSWPAWIPWAALAVLCLGAGLTVAGCGGGGGGDDGGTQPIGDPPDAPFTVTGTVETDDVPPRSIEGATVTISTSPAEQTTTDSDGTYGFWVAAGDYTVRAEQAGFQPNEVPVTLPAGGQVTADIVLTPL